MENLSNAPGDEGAAVTFKYEKVLSQNNGLLELKQLRNVLLGVSEEAFPKLTLNDVSCLANDPFIFT